MAFAVVTGTAALVAVAGSVAGAASSRPVIAFGSERGGPVRIAVIGLKPGQRILPSSSAGMDVEPSWSPNGSRLAIATSDATGQDFDIATDRARTAAARKRITSGAAWDEKPAWSPDGKWIAFASDRNGNFDIYVIHPDGTGMRQLTASTLRGHRSVVVAGRVEDRLHEPPRRFPAHLDDERERLGASGSSSSTAAGRLPGRPTARASPSSTTMAATTRSTPSVPTARASPS